MAFFQARPLRAAILSAALLASGAQAADEGAAEYREAIFEAIGGHMSAMVGIIKGEVPHQQDLALHAKGIAALAPVTQHIFPADSYIEGGHAKAEIWSDPETFAERRQNFLEAAAALGAVADSGDQAAFMGAFKTLGGTCKGCHDSFRAK